MINQYDNRTSSYEMTPLTMAVIGQFDPDGSPRTYVLEEQEEYAVDDKPSKVIDYACRFFGASLRGRQDGTRDICGITHKAPISIDPLSGMYFFPTASPLKPNCAWISHSHVDDVHKTKDNRTRIDFKNGKTITVDVSFGSMLNQLQRTAQFRYLLDDRIKILQKHNAGKVAERLP